MAHSPQGEFCIYLFIIYLFTYYLFLAALGLLAVRRLSLVAASGSYSLLWCVGFSLWGLLLLQSTGSRSTGLVALRHVESSWTRARTRVPCIGSRILNHCASREVPEFCIFYSSL